MARYFGRRSGGRRKSKGGSLYARANNENISVLRLYSDDSTTLPTGIIANSVGEFLYKAGLIQQIATSGAVDQQWQASKALKIRLIAVAWSANGTTTNPGGTYLEFNGDGSTYNIAQLTNKPIRTRVPQKDYIDGQWMTLPAGKFGVVSGATPIEVGVIGSVMLNTPLFTTDGTVNYVDIAVRY